MAINYCNDNIFLLECFYYFFAQKSAHQCAMTPLFVTTTFDSYLKQETYE